MIKLKAVLDSGTSGQVSVRANESFGCGCCSNWEGCTYTSMDAMDGLFPVSPFDDTSSKGFVLGINGVMGVDYHIVSKPAFLGYLFPILALCAGAIIGEFIGGELNSANQELISIIFALSCFLTSFFVGRWLESKCLLSVHL